MRNFAGEGREGGGCLVGREEFNPPAVIMLYIPRLKIFRARAERINVRDGQLSATLYLRLDFPRDFRPLGAHPPALCAEIGNAARRTAARARSDPLDPTTCKI